MCVCRVPGPPHRQALQPADQAPRQEGRGLHRPLQTVDPPDPRDQARAAQDRLQGRSQRLRLGLAQTLAAKSALSPRPPLRLYALPLPLLLTHSLAPLLLRYAPTAEWIREEKERLRGVRLAAMTVGTGPPPSTFSLSSPVFQTIDLTQPPPSPQTSSSHRFVSNHPPAPSVFAQPQPTGATASPSPATSDPSATVQAGGGGGQPHSLTHRALHAAYMKPT